MRGERREPPTPQKFEIELDNEADLKRVAQIIEPYTSAEAAEQFIFVLKSLTNFDFTNHCNDATRAFGEALAAEYGGEESFLELAPKTRVSDARSYDKMQRTDYRGDFHSAAVVSFDHPAKQPASLIIDLTAYTIKPTKKRHAALVIECLGDEKMALHELASVYGGSWRIEFRLNPITKKFRYQP